MQMQSRFVTHPFICHPLTHARSQVTANLSLYLNRLQCGKRSVPANLHGIYVSNKLLRTLVEVTWWSRLL